MAIRLVLSDCVTYIFISCISHITSTYVDHRYVFTIYSTVEDLGGLMSHMFMIEVTENGSLFQVYINDILKIMYT